MLESEAKTKWCPMFQATPNNRWLPTSPPMTGNLSMCMASGCACWIDDGYNDKAGEREGHCGLAR